MNVFTRLLAIATIAATSSALYTPRQAADDTDSACVNGTVVTNTTLTLNGNDIQLTTFNCDPSSQPLDVDLKSDIDIGGIIIPLPPIIIPIPFFPFPIFPFPFPFPQPKPPPPKPTKTSSSSSAAPTPTSVNVCNVACTDSCGSLGDLPPISEDCQTIYDSINITNGAIAPTFDVQSNHIEQLTFGTCRLFFENFSNETLTYCWTAFSQTGQGAGTDCFPPVQPVNSAGFCTPSDASWQVGVAHS